jgi:ATP-dependent helicase HrpB
VVVTAAPGAGKTTRVPPALVADGPVLLLQPRRVAARAIASRIAEERGWTLGREVGWHVRFDRRSSPQTRLLVATEGMLTARLQQDPLLSDVRTVVIDEFHERSIHADLGLALARQAWLARQDLNLVVMSATLDASRVSVFLDGCPIVDVQGRTFPLTMTYAPQLGVEQAILGVLTGRPAAPDGAILCFLPGAPEIRRMAGALASAPAVAGVPILPLHGGLSAEEQDAAVRPAPTVGPRARRVILATNIAETTLTVPDVTCVIDTGWQKVARYDAARAIDSLELERVSRDSADQRAGRAGRTGPGAVIRLWDERQRLRPHREPDVARVDLLGPALDVVAWGGDPRRLQWFEPPPSDALDRALDLLRRLGALDETNGLTPQGRDMQRLALHPRLARLLLADRGSRAAALACAVLSERGFAPPRRQATSCDLLAVIDREHELPGPVRFAAQRIGETAERVLGSTKRSSSSDEETFRRALLAAYPDRVARRREPKSDRLVLGSGTGARLGRESGVHDAEFVVAVEVTAATGPSPEALVRMASRVEREWLTPTSQEIVHRLEGREGTVRAVLIERYDQLPLSERPSVPDPDAGARLLADEYLRRGPSDEDAQLLRRAEFAGLGVSFEQLVHAAAAGAESLKQMRPAERAPRDLMTQLDREAPLRFRVPTGRDVPIDYRESGAFVTVKLQELFGLADSPRIGRAGAPVTFELLAPNGRPVQVTRDLRSFWTRGYPEVRKELRARYPKHSWPEDPWTAKPTKK